jgi:multidrug efflux pump
VQLVTRGILLGEMRPDTTDEEIEIRVRLPEEDRVLSTLDTLKVRTADGLVPLSNFVTRQPVAKLAEINRVDQERYYDVKADVEAGLSKAVVVGPDGGEKRLAVLRAVADGAEPSSAAITAPNGKQYDLVQLTEAETTEELRTAVENGEASIAPINPNERIAVLTEWLNTNPFDSSITWEWTGDQEEQAESQAFLSSAFLAALGLMFVILLAQFNSFYNSVLVLLAVVLSTTGVLIGMLVMEQPFSIIMTGTGIVALAGIVVNNNIVLIDTYQEYSRYMPRIDAIVRTAEARIRPVLLTTLTTMAGLTPMMFGLSLDFINGGYTIDSPTALWWKQLATAVVFGLGIATVLTLIVTPSMLALRVWVTTYAIWLGKLLARVTAGRSSQIAQDMAIGQSARAAQATEIVWDEQPVPRPEQATGTEEDHPTIPPGSPLKAAE